MNRRRDALRRGIRSLIQDTSRELAGLTELAPPAQDRTLSPELPPAKVAPAPEEPPPLGPNPAGPAPHPDAPAGPAAPLPPAGPAAQLGAQVESAPLPWPDAPPAGHPPLSLPPTDGPGPKPSASQQARFRKVIPTLAIPRARPQKAGRKKAVRGKAAVPPSTSRPAHRLRGRRSEDLVLDGVNPRQAHARKGVCFAYFINKRCWRVPQAYCNTALHVCAIRECPVYHLHKDALERRFTEKYKHFW